ncbi:MAG: MBL fold metallo-hydrolase [Candidatus Wallbacteria bacterium]|nr:MBL fold metallo-hydrolase [Candidatus Wallbacteria bacterium]
MKIRYFGHSCFLLSDSRGRTVVYDPFPPTIGYGRLDITAETVLVSHGHFDHNWTEGVRKPCQVIRKPGQHRSHGLDITGIPSFHDKENGELRGRNIIFCLQMDGLTLVHLGDLGHDVPEEVRSADIVFAPAGGTYTLDAMEALAAGKGLGAKIVFPMHFRTADAVFPIAGVSDLSAVPGAVVHNASFLELTRHTMPEQLQFAILRPVGGGIGVRA